MTVYQIVEDKQFEVIVKETTLEECTDVVYTFHEIAELYPDARSIGWTNTVWFKPQNVVNEVVRQLEDKKVKVVVLELSERTIKQIANEYNEQFKQHGFMYSTKLNHFKRWKQPKAKAVTVPARLMNDLRIGTVYAVQRFIWEKYQVDANLKSFTSKVGQHNSVLMGRKLGVTFKYVLSQDCFDYGTAETKIKIYLEAEGHPELYQKTMDEYKEWFMSN